MAKIKIPQQKTFKGETHDHLDEIVNAWLKQRHISGKPMPMHGKSYSAPCKGSPPDHCATYYFMEEIDDDSIKGD